ncbi:Peptidoglycan/LPS O-acetylase OafA/YrhL, contains acyltransferase and SGNH-hydrolase domains [Nocardioides sp. YR527]|nr:acyltransferase [Nocardioides sp. YR527]SDK46548.1 Peptidoglycan/LPS O-acetylase OafA/YrhL, contains acyltransferase and SGNH-hydrolase domains [Nocardioides sp. YR527]
MADQSYLDRRFLTLDALRAVGALMVVLTHVAFHTGRYPRGWTGAMLAHFDLGVALFFVVSGFLLARPWFAASAAGARPPSTGRYLWKRALRILPLYWVVVAVCLIAAPANSDVGVGGWIANLTLTQIYTQDTHAYGLAHMWSLCTEVAFYLALPLVVRLLTPRDRLDLRRVLVLCLLLSIGGVVFAAGARTWFDQPFAAEWLPAYLPWFLAGTALAACSVDARMRARLDAAARDLAGWWLLALGLFVAACTPITGPTGLVDAPTPAESALKCVLYGAVAVCVIFPLVFGPELEGPVRRWLARPVPSALGEISYGVFSIHMFVLLMGMELLGFGTFNDRFWTVLGMTLAVTIPIAALSYVLFERRVMRLRSWRPSGRRPKRRPEAAPASESAPESASEPGVTEAAAATSTIATSESA